MFWCPNRGNSVKICQIHSQQLKIIEISGNPGNSGKTPAIRDFEWKANKEIAVFDGIRYIALNQGLPEALCQLGGFGAQIVENL